MGVRPFENWLKEVVGDLWLEREMSEKGVPLEMEEGSNAKQNILL